MKNIYRNCRQTCVHTSEYVWINAVGTAVEIVPGYNLVEKRVDQEIV